MREYTLDQLRLMRDQARVAIEGEQSSPDGGDKYVIESCNNDLTNLTAAIDKAVSENRLSVTI